MHRFRILILIVLAALIPALGWPQANVNEGLETAQIYVDGTNGNDNNPGTITQPLQTIGAAVTLAETNNQSNIGSTVIINPGTYREAVTISPLLGATSMPITFEAATNGTVFVSGAEQYTGWTAYAGNPSVYTTPWTYAWGLCSPMAGAYLPIPDVTMRREMVFINGTPLTQVTEFSALTVPGTFYVDETGGTLYIWPPTGTDISTADVEVSTQPLIWNMQGQSNVVVRGLTFEYGNPCRENAEVLVNSNTAVQNVLFDADNFDWSNAEGLNLGPTTSYVTVQNSTANHNGEAGFQNTQVSYALFQSDTASFNDWRGAQGAYYRFNSGGAHFYQMHNLTLNALNTTYNQTYGMHFDSDNVSVTASNELLAQNLLDGISVERNEGPITFSNSTFCGGSPSTYASNISFGLRDSDSVTITTSNLVSSNQALAVSGQTGGMSWYNWQTGQSYTADNNYFTFTHNVVEPLAGQDVFNSAGIGASDWNVFQATLTSNNNTWWSSGNSDAFIVSVPTSNTAADFTTWQSDTGQDASSTWATPSGNPGAACAVTADLNDFWFVVPFSQTYFTVSPGASAVWTANIVPLLNFADNVQLSADGVEYIPGASGSWSATTVGSTGAPNFTVTTSPATPAGTYAVTMIANDGSLTHTIEGLLIVDNTVVLSSQNLDFGNQRVNTTSATESVTLTNNGSAALSMSNITLGAPNGNQFGESNNCGSSVAPNSSCTLNFTFTPTASGSASSTVTITDGAPSSPQTITLSGTGTAPAASLSPSSLTFSGQAVGTTSAAQAITLSNTGTASLTITSIVVSGGNASSFAQTNNCGSTLAAGSSCTINVTFDPTKAGTLLAGMTVTDNATPAAQVTSLTGTGDQAAASLSPGTLTFSGQAVGTASATQTITLTDTGTATLNITSIVLGGANTGDFTETNDCGASLGVNASCTITVTFNPTKSGTRAAKITVTDNAVPSTQTATLTGTGDQPGASLSPGSLTFSSQAVGTTSASQAITLSNTGTASLSIASVAITGTNSGDFGQTNTCGSSVAAGASCSVNVTFDPSKVGTRTASVTVTDNAPSTTQTANLSGTGSQIGVSPGTLTFAGQAVDTISSSQTITLTNSGTFKLTITSIAITGTNTADFAETDNCGSSVTAGTSCSISVTFNPTATGSRSASVTVTDNSSPGTLTTTLSGSGTQAGVSLTSSLIAFGNQIVGTSSAAQAITLTNTGTAGLSITSLTFSGSDSADFKQTNTCGSSVAAGGNCTVDITFTPAQAGLRTATLNIADNAPASPQLVSVSGSSGLLSTSPTNTVDFYGDGEGEPAVFRPSSGTWYVHSNSGTTGNLTQVWGQPGDVPVAADYDGDGKADFAVWRPSTGTWYIMPSGGGKDIIQQWGLSGDVPVPADYDGDGKADMAVWRPSNGTWYIIPSSGGPKVIKQWGLAGDVPVIGDYDGDRKADYAVFRPSNGTWYVILSSSVATVTTQWGLPGDIPVEGDYDGDGKTDYAVWRASTATWYVIQSSTEKTVNQQWGVLGDIPVVGDYNGDGKNDYAVFRPSNGTWYFNYTSGGTGNQQYGETGDIPATHLTPHHGSARLIANFDADRKADIGVFRPSSGTWYAINSSTGTSTSQVFGENGDIVVPGDYDGDGKSDLAVWRPSNQNWYVALSSTGQMATEQWGEAGDIPVPGDYDGDGKTDYAIWRPSNQTWYVLYSSTGKSSSQQWGASGDIPVPADYDGDGKTDYAVWRPSNQTWYVFYTSTGKSASQQWGARGDIPVPGDYDGDTRADFTVFRPSTGTWYTIRSSDGKTVATAFGSNGDIPVAKDYDGDQKTDIAVWRPSNATWYILQSSNGETTTTQWGVTTDLSVNKPTGQ